MSKELRDVLRIPHETLTGSFSEHLEATEDLQHTLIFEIVPGLVDEFQLDEDSREFCMEWLYDISTYSDTCI